MNFLNRPPDPRSRPDRQFPPLSACRAGQLRRELADTVAARGGRLEIADTTARILCADAESVTVDLAPLITALATDDSPHAVPARMDTGDVYASPRVRLLPTRGLDAGQRELLTRTRISDFTVDTAACLALAAGRGSRPVGPAGLAGHDDVGTRNLRAELTRTQVSVDAHDLGHRRPGEYLWRAGAVETVSELGEDERIRITPGDWLMRRARGG